MSKMKKSEALNYAYKFLIGEYGEKRVSKVKNEIIVHYPELWVENELGCRHRILNLYIKLVFEDNKLEDFKGIRTTFSNREFSDNFLYIHSHLNCVHRDNNGEYNISWNDFCRGSEMNNIINNYNNNMSLSNLNLFLFSLDNYVTTESLKGGPYIRMAELYTGTTRNNNNVLENAGPEFISKLIENSNFSLISSNTIRVEDIETSELDFSFLPEVELIEGVNMPHRPRESNNLLINGSLTFKKKKIKFNVLTEETPTLYKGRYVDWDILTNLKHNFNRLLENKKNEILIKIAKKV